MAVLDAIKNLTNSISGGNNTTSSSTASNTSSNATQKKTKQGFWSKFLSALKAFFVGK